jgi:hypothetical protein
MHPVDEFVFGTYRGVSFVTSIRFKQTWWCLINHSHLEQTPANWFWTPSLKKYYPAALEVLDQYRIYKKIPSFKKLKSYLVNKIESGGTCHGQCLVMLEQIKDYPNRKPADLVSKMDKLRLMYFQTVEYVRGDCQDLFVECVKLLPPADQRTEVMYKRGLKNEWRETLSQHQNKAYIFRFWDPKNKVGHSMLYVVRDHAFWFYDCSTVGLYEYKTPGKLFDGFYSHLKAFFPGSYHKETRILVEEYLL